MGKHKPLIISFVGARPQFVKIAPLAKSLSGKFHHIIVHSGQHYDRMMSDIFFKELSIPKFKFNLSVGSGNHGEMTGAMMSRFEKLLLKKRPSMVLVYGDTNSTLAGALAAAKLNIPVAHIEAGMRSYRMDMPEEINRRLTDHISSLLFCPTVHSSNNLKKEGITNGVILSGDLMYQQLAECKRRIAGKNRILKNLNLNPREYLLLTLHRAGNVDDEKQLATIVDIIVGLQKPILFPVHPRTRESLRRYHLINLLKSSQNVKLTEPLSYLDNLNLIANAQAVLTDSGGVQKEAVFLGTPCLTMRDETEWIETLKRGNCLVGLSKKKIVSALSHLPRIQQNSDYKIKGMKPSEIITSALSGFLRNF